MQKTALNDFVEQIMKIDPGYPGMGSASTGILGSAGMSGDVTNSLRTAVLEFAAAYVHEPMDEHALKQATDTLESALYGMRTISGITEARLNELVEMMQQLLTKKSST